MRTLLLAGIVFLVVMELLGAASLKNLRVSQDFRQFYSAGILVRTEPANLYSLSRQKQIQDEFVSPQELGMPAVHPSYEAVFYSIFTLLPYRSAYLAFIFFNTCLLVAIGCLALRRDATISPAALAAGLFLFLPVIIAVWQGQDSVLFLFLCSLCCTQLSKGKDRSAAFFLALALFRFHLAIPIACFIAIRRGWRFLTVFSVTGAVIAGMCVAITGLPATRDMLRIMSSFTLSSDQSGTMQRALGIQPLAMPNLRGLLYGLGVSRLPAHVSAAIIGAASLALFGFCLWRSRRIPQLSVVVALGVACTILIAGHLYIHDATLLLLPIFLLRKRIPAPLLVALYAVPLLLFLTGLSLYFYLIAIPVLGLLPIAMKIEQEPAPVPPHNSPPLYTW